MPKLKTHKAMSKRFKITATGKAIHRKANRGHKFGHRRGERKSQLRIDGCITGKQAKHILECLRPAGR
ncbi:large ribosomal subunit protein bL35 [Lacunimicrobium album]|jgi:ribosomal protein L35